MSRALRQCSDLHLWVHLSGDEEIEGIAPFLVLSEWLASDGLTPEQFFHTATSQMRLHEFTSSFHCQDRMSLVSDKRFSLVLRGLVAWNERGV